MVKASAHTGGYLCSCLLCFGCDSRALSIHKTPVLGGRIRGKVLLLLIFPYITTNQSSSQDPEFKSGEWQDPRHFSTSPFWNQKEGLHPKYADFKKTKHEWVLFTGKCLACRRTSWKKVMINHVPIAVRKVI